MGRGKEEAGENAAEEQQLGKSSANFWGGLLFLTEAKPNDSPFSNLCSSLKNGQPMTLASFHHASLDKGHFLLITLVAQCPLRSRIFQEPVVGSACRKSMDPHSVQNPCLSPTRG